jgi:D-glycero-D-manno-heptose 1,7-bisphosphate phosphatase
MNARTPPRQAVIVAGGRGTRLRPLTDDRPKAMVEVGGKPFLDHLLELLREEGLQEILLLLGYRADAILEHVGDGSAWGLKVSAVVTDPDDETSSRMLTARGRLDDRFLFLYSDNYWPLRMERLWGDYVRSDRPAIVTVYRNRDGYTRSNVRVADGAVVEYDPTRSRPGLGGVEIGYAILPRDVVDLIDRTDLPFEKVVYPRLVEGRLLAAHETDHRYYSMGSMERLPLTDAFFSRRPMLILDRDGVLNRRPPRAEYVRRPEDVEWMPGAFEALKLLAGVGYRFVVVSNQAGIARGVMSHDDLAAVERRMRDDLEREGLEVEQFYYCPHGWDEGCDCRKPRPGMLFQAQRDFHLDLTRTLFVGDDERDGQAAEAAGCRFAMVDDEHSLLDVARELVAADLVR